MKIAITGHLNGIGKSCYELLSHKGHNVIGFDVEDSSGDIAKDRDDIILKANNCEVFINNAFTMSGAQIDMFNEIYEKWKDEPKQIINICSASKFYPNIFSAGIDYNYIAKKKVFWKNIVKTHSDKIMPDVKVRVHTVSPGLVDTNITKPLKDDTYKMSPDSVALYVAWVLEQPDDIEVLDVAVRRKPYEDR